MAKPSLPQGTRDFGPDVVRKRTYILDTIKNVFELYGFQPLETPAMENIETLMGKYGEEGDKLIFRVLDSGNPFQKEFFKGLGECLRDFSDSSNEFMKSHGSDKKSVWEGPFWEINPAVLESISNSLLKEKRFSKYLSKLKYEVSNKALKYDLTIPFARYVAMNHSHLTFPFKRYQIQPVWRADRPQKGRYREFYQCDADVAGSTSLLTEIELLKIYDDVFRTLKIPDIEIRINSRSILKAFSALLGDENRFVELATIIDKLDKAGKEKTKEDLIKSFGNLNINNEDIIEKFLDIEGENEKKLNAFFDLFGVMLPELKPEVFGRVISIVRDFNNHFTHSKLNFDFTLARGLNYYTGLIIEVKCNAVKIGSIGGGGAYHNLTELFGISNMPGVGISFGVDRIFDTMEELRLFPENLLSSSKILFLNLGLNESIKCLELAEHLREKEITCEIYPDVTNNIDKQYKYAEKKNIPFVVIIDQKELKNGTCTIKNISTGAKQTIPVGELINHTF